MVQRQILFHYRDFDRQGATYSLDLASGNSLIFRQRWGLGIEALPGAGGTGTEDRRQEADGGRLWALGSGLWGGEMANVHPHPLLR